MNTQDITTVEFIAEIGKGTGEGAAWIYTWTVEFITKIGKGTGELAPRIFRVKCNI